MNADVMFSPKHYFNTVLNNLKSKVMTVKRRSAVAPTMKVEKTTKEVSKEEKLSEDNSVLRGELKKMAKERDTLHAQLTKKDLEVTELARTNDELAKQEITMGGELSRYERLYRFYLRKFEDNILNEMQDSLM